MHHSKLNSFIRETAKEELKEIFGFLKTGKGSTEKFAQSEEETVPTQTFSLEHLRSLKTSKEIRDYARRTLKPLGSGQARVTYGIDEQTVLKVALSDNKKYQNVNEVNNASCLGPELAVQVLEHDKNFNWLLEERIQPIKKEQLIVSLNNLMGLTPPVSFQDSFDIKQYFAALSYISQADPEVDQRYLDIHQQALKQSSWYQNFLTKTKHCKFASWDFHHANWGIRSKDGRLVLLDLGFNQQDISPEDQFFKEEREVVGFSLGLLKSMTDLSEITEYCMSNLGKPLAEGQGRVVWEIDSSKIIKVLLPTKREGNQNEQEYQNATCMTSKFAVKIFDFDPNGFKWLIEENLFSFANREAAFVKAINKITGYNFQHDDEITDLFAGWPALDDIRDHLLENNEWFKELMQKLESCDVASFDFHPGNWGLRKETGEVVLLDLGF